MYILQEILSVGGSVHFILSDRISLPDGKCNTQMEHNNTLSNGTFHKYILTWIATKMKSYISLTSFFFNLIIWKTVQQDHILSDYKNMKQHVNQFLQYLIKTASFLNALEYHLQKLHFWANILHIVLQTNTRTNNKQIKQIPTSSDWDYKFINSLRHGPSFLSAPSHCL